MNFTQGNRVQLFIVLFSRTLILSTRLKCILRHFFYLIFSLNSNFCINFHLTHKKCVGLNFHLRATFVQNFVQLFKKKECGPLRIHTPRNFCYSSLVKYTTLYNTFSKTSCKTSCRLFDFWLTFWRFLNFWLLANVVWIFDMKKTLIMSN